MHFNHGEFPPEVPEEVEEQGFTLEIIIETEPIFEREEVITEKLPEHFPQDDYLQKELEPQEREKLWDMAPKRIP